MRMHPADRREQVLFAAIEIAQDGHLYTMSAVDVGALAMCARSLINYYFTSIETLREHVIRWGVRNNDGAIMAQAILRDDPLVSDMTPYQKKIAAEHVNDD